MCVACPALGPPWKCDLTARTTQAIPVGTEAPGGGGDPAPHRPRGSFRAPEESNPAQLSFQAILPGAGEHLILGSSRGVVSVLCSRTLGLRGRLQLPSGSRILSLAASRRGTQLLVHSYDRVIRLLDVQTAQVGRL